jgi:hypothetical protein
VIELVGAGFTTLAHCDVGMPRVIVKLAPQRLVVVITALDIAECTEERPHARLLKELVFATGDIRHQFHDFLRLQIITSSLSWSRAE